MVRAAREVPEHFAAGRRGGLRPAVWVALLTYLAFSAGALLWMHWRAPGSIVLRLSPGGRHGSALLVLGVGLGCGVGLVAASAAVTAVFGWARELERQFAAGIGRLEPSEIVVLAVSSGVGEELLFRGVVQEWLGLASTSLLFGALHVPLTRGLWPWPFFAAASGFLFGSEEGWAGGLWAPVLSHAVVNGCNLWRISSRA